MKRVGVLGASGFIGTYLRTALEERGDEVVASSLRDPVAAARATASCDAIVNLAGEPIAQYWTPRAQRRLLESRVDAPRAYLDELARATSRPKVYVSASAVGYYGTSENVVFDETSMPGGDFLAQVCAAWEAQAHRASALGMRVAVVRTGVALALDGGALTRMLPAFRLGLGGAIGSGRQWLSWIHIADLTAIYLFALDDASGALNATAPVPATNSEFTNALAQALRRPAVLPVPLIALRMILGKGAMLLTEGQRVLPKRTQALGFSFAYPTLSDALDALLHPENA